VWNNLLIKVQQRKTLLSDTEYVFVRLRLRCIAIFFVLIAPPINTLTCLLYSLYYLSSLSCCCWYSLRLHEQRRNLFARDQGLSLCRRLSYSQHQLPSQYVPPSHSNLFSVFSRRRSGPVSGNHVAANKLKSKPRNSVK